MAIEVSDLRKSYGAVEALRGLSFDVRRGEVFGLLGPNGAGKTTTVEILEGYRARSAGSVRVLGQDPAVRDRRQQERVGIVLQSCGFHSHITVHEAVGHMAKAYPRPRAVDETIALVGLEDKADERSGRLSGGQRQRLAVGRALVQDTPVLVFDEATSSLDAESEAAMRTAIAAATRGRTTLVIAHQLSTIRAADRLVVLDHGEVVETGTFDQLLTERGHFAALVAAGFGGPDR